MHQPFYQWFCVETEQQFATGIGSEKAMFDHKKIQDPEDFFIPLSKRREKGVYFYRISSYNGIIGDFLIKYYETARRVGVIIEGRIPNPDEKNLSYFEEVMGLGFQMSEAFFTESLKLWLPRMNEFQRRNIASSIFRTLDLLRKNGKNENMLKNAYIKFMCWLYYKFERIVNHLGEENLPKILYEGEVGKYELMMLSVLSDAGCDVVLLQYNGDDNYHKTDPQSQYSEALPVPDGGKFPADFNLKWMEAQMRRKVDRQRLYGVSPQLLNCTNAWIEGRGLSDMLKSPETRVRDPNLFYNCFLRINGVEDKLTYVNELYQFQSELKRAGRKTVIVDSGLIPPIPEEIRQIRRKSYTLTETAKDASHGKSFGYTRPDQMIMDLLANIRYTGNPELQRLMHKAFVDILLEESEASGLSLNKLTNKAVFLLCFLKRYQSALFSGWKAPQIGCFILLGGCKNENEVMFVRFLSRLPVDVLILVPDLGHKCILQDKMLYEINYADAMTLEKYPTQEGEVQIGTAAYHAERELDTIMYQDSGMYRNQQYSKANAVILQTTYEEIALLWDQELKYRPNFGTVDSVVNVPVLFAKVSGVKDGLVPQYWAGIKALVTQDTMVIKNIPYIRPTDPNPMKAHTAEFYKNGRLQRAKIKSHPAYPYGFLREEIQEHILDKLQLMLTQKPIRGMFENGTEYTVIASVLNLNKDIVRMIQRFDFTKKNPKIIFILNNENVLSAEDTILAAFLNLAGFDILFFVPTGYQSVEKYFNHRSMEEHQIGDYMYDLHVPDFKKAASGTKPSWRDIIFKRGR